MKLPEHPISALATSGRKYIDATEEYTRVVIKITEQLLSEIEELKNKNGE